MTLRSHKIQLCCTAQFVALVATLTLSGCGTVKLFGQYDLSEDPAVADTPWPRLVDTPTPPSVGSYSAAVPDPANGTRTQTDLSTAAVFAEGRAKELAAPVISDEEKERLLKNAIVNHEHAEAKKAEAEKAEAEQE